MTFIALVTQDTMSHTPFKQEPKKTRINVACIQSYVDSGTPNSSRSVIQLTDGTKLDVMETVAEIDAIVEGGHDAR